MIKKHRFIIVNSNRLIIAWHLLNGYKKKKKYEYEYGKGFVSFSFYLFVEYGIITIYEIALILGTFLEKEIVREVHVKQQDFNGEDDTPNLINESYFTSGKMIKNRKENPFFDIGFPLGLDLSRDDCLYDFFIKLDCKRCKIYIKQYLDDWRRGVFIHGEKNLLQARKQLGVVVYRIKRLLMDYPPSNLIVKYDKARYEEIDFVATMLFLEQIRDIDIVEMSISGKEISFRINVKDKFFKDFEDEGSFVTSRLENIDLDKIIEDPSVKKIVNKIVLKAPKLLSYKDIEYEIKENKVPYRLIYLAREKKGIIERSELRSVTGESEERIKKALNNFRNSLRKKFNFPSSELFFELKGGLIQFKGDIFDFS